jgi:hypothetical protein
MIATDDFCNLVKRAIDEQIRELVIKEAAAVAKRVEDQIRMDVGAIAARVSQRISYAYRANELVIVVDFKNLKT